MKILGVKLTEIRKVIGLMENRKYIYLPAILVFAFIEIMGIPLIAYGMKGIIKGIESKDIVLFWKSFVLIGIKHLSWAIYAPFSVYLCDFASKKTMMKERSSMVNCILKLPQVEIDKRPVGDYLSIISNDLGKVEQIFDRSFYQTIRSFLQGSAGVVVMFVFDWRFAIVVIALGIINLKASEYFGNKLEKIGTSLQEKLSDINTNVYQLVKGLKTARTSFYGIRKEAHFSEETQLESVLRQESGSITSTMSAVMIGLNLFSYLSVLMIGAIFVLNGLSTWPSVVALLGLKFTTDELFSASGMFLAQLRQNIAGYRRVESIKQIQAEDIQDLKGFDFESFDGAFKVSDLTFAYNTDNIIFENFNMQIPKTGVTLIIGDSGSGKSTLMKLMLGLYKPRQGKITISEMSNASDISDVRRSIGYVAQKSVLFNGTILENITMFDENSNRDRAILCAKKAQAEKFILAMPQGFDSCVADDGLNLSGGERQRIAIARALYKKVDIFLFDEITASLDEENTLEIMSLLKEISNEKSIVMISHDMRFKEFADCIVHI